MLVSRETVAPVFMFPGVHRRVLNTGERGRLRFRIGAEERIIQQGDSWLVPSSVPHVVTALEDSVAIDVFSPPREDFLQA